MTGNNKVTASQVKHFLQRHESMWVLPTRRTPFNLQKILHHDAESFSYATHRCRYSVCLEGLLSIWRISNGGQSIDVTLLKTIHFTS